MGFSVRISGSRACFTMPESKVERESYPVPTHSALQGILQAIYWKPEFDYVIDDVLVLNPVRYGSVCRNELKNVLKGSVKGERDRCARGEFRTHDPHRGDPSDARTYVVQRMTRYLKDVDYVVSGHIVILSCDDGNPDPVGKHLHILQDRLEFGRCFYQPCLGLREFGADFCVSDAGLVACDEVRSMPHRIGRMFYDMRRDGGSLVPIWCEASIRDGHVSYENLSYHGEYLNVKGYPRVAR